MLRKKSNYIVFLALFSMLLISCEEYIVDKNFSINDSVAINPIDRMILTGKTLYICGGCFKYQDNRFRVNEDNKIYGLVSLDINGNLKTIYYKFTKYIGCYNFTLLNQNNFIFLKVNYDIHSKYLNNELIIKHKDNLESLKPISCLNSFISEPNANYLVNDMLKDNNGNLLIGGEFCEFNNSKKFKKLIRINAKGKLDSTFKFSEGDFKSFHLVKKIAIQRDNRILIVGKFSFLNDSVETKNICRLNLDGSIDRNFNKNSMGFNGFLDDFNDILLEDTTIYITGNFNIYNNKHILTGYIRLDTNGSIFRQFNYSYKGFYSPNNESIVKKIRKLNDSTMILSGYFDKFNSKECSNGIVFMKKNGDIVNDFNLHLSKQTIVNEIAVLNQDTFFLSGKFNQNGLKTNIIRVIKKRNTLNIILICLVLSIMAISIVGYLIIHKKNKFKDNSLYVDFL